MNLNGLVPQGTDTFKILLATQRQSRHYQPARHLDALPQLILPCGVQYA